ncbi:MAG: IMP dehydrogenase [Acidimicrobiia bacterium]|nr:IMP dehydrogenase [Acidimicrobiia bacterium]
MGLDNLRLGLTFDDVLLVPQRSSIRSRRDISLTTQLTRNHALAIPIVAANMDTVCEAEMAEALATLGGVGIIHRFLTVEVQADMVRQVKAAPVGERAACGADGRLLVGAAVGTDHDALSRSAALIEAGADVIVLDIAHGHADHAIDTLREIKVKFSDTDVVAGNVATRAGAEQLVAAGADAIKIGVGPGGVCTTRLVAGVGVPQLTAIADCAGLTNADGARVPVIADGGIRSSGDIAKALGSGADTVMIGSLFAGTKESPGEVEQSPRGLVKRVRGMASFEAIEARAARAGADIDDEYFEQRAPEGVEGTVPYRGEVTKLVGNLLAGLRSGMSYSDARTVPEFWEKAEFIRVTHNGAQENKPHATLFDH